MDAGEPAEPLTSALTAGLDYVVVDRSLLRPIENLAADYGVEADELQTRLVAFDGPGCPFAVYPEDLADCAVLLRRVFSPAAIATRLEYLRQMGWYPREGAPVVVHGDRAALPTVAEVAARLGDKAVVLIELAPYRGDGDFADAVAPLLAGPVYRMPAAVSHEDIVAAISASSLFVGPSLHGQLTAALYAGGPGADAHSAPVDAFIDSVADTVAGAEGATGREPGYVAALRRAHDRRGHQLATERVVFADHVADLRRALDTASATALAAQQQATEDAAVRRTAETELAALKATRMFRWSQRPRDLYRLVRQWRNGPA